MRSKGSQSVSITLPCRLMAFQTRIGVEHWYSTLNQEEKIIQYDYKTTVNINPQTDIQDTIIIIAAVTKSKSKLEQFG